MCLSSRDMSQQWFSLCDMPAACCLKYSQFDFLHHEAGTKCLQSTFNVLLCALLQHRDANLKQSKSRGWEIANVTFCDPKKSNVKKFSSKMSEKCILWAFICFVQEIWWLIRESGRFGLYPERVDIDANSVLPSYNAYFIAQSKLS